MAIRRGSPTMPRAGRWTTRARAAATHRRAAPGSPTRQLTHQVGPGRGSAVSQADLEHFLPEGCRPAGGCSVHGEESPRRFGVMLDQALSFSSWTFCASTVAMRRASSGLRFLSSASSVYCARIFMSSAYTGVTGNARVCFNASCTTGQYLLAFVYSGSSLYLGTTLGRPWALKKSAWPWPAVVYLISSHAPSTLLAPLGMM